MTTMSVVDVESIVGDMPAQVCEMHDVEFNPLCQSQATWVARVHVTDYQTCWVSVLNFCEPHIQEVRALGKMFEHLPCTGCGVSTMSVFNAVRL